MSANARRAVWFMTIGMVPVVLDLVHLTGIVYTLRRQGRWPLDRDETFALFVVLCLGALVGLWDAVEALRAGRKERPVLWASALALVPVFALASAYNFLVVLFSGISH